MEIFPPEIVTHILKYLSFDDRRQIALVNPTWYYASIHPIFIRKELFVYEDTDLMTKFLDFQQMLMNSKREVFNLKFYNFTSYLEPDSIFWNKLNSRITSLHLVNLVEFNDLFLDCLTNMNNLETLELRNIREFTTTVKIRNALLKLHSLSLFNIYFISDKEFNNILQYAPHLKELCFNDCNILCWGQSIKRFYPNYKISGGLINYDSPYIFTDVNIINNLKNIKNIEHLMLQNCCKIFMQLPVETKLKSLVLSVVDEAHNLEKFNLTLAIHSMSLQQLDISHIPCCSLFALTKLHNLKVLKVLYTTDFNSMCGDSKACLNKFSESLSCLKNISSLTIVPMLTFDFSIITIPNCVLSSLNILDCAIENCHKLVDVGTNLISLTIQNGNILTASDLQYLFGNHTNLRHLLINKCINFNDDILMKSPPSVNLKGLIELKIFDVKLTSKCLQYIKLNDLKVLSIKNIFIEIGEEKNFEDCLKLFGSSVPALTQFEICLSLNDNNASWKDTEDSPLLDSVSIFQILKPYYKRLKLFKCERRNVCSERIVQEV